MNAAELIRTAASLSDRDVNAGMRRLAQAQEFPALLAWLMRNESAWASAVSSQTLADKPGKLAHTAGSIHALKTLQGQLLEIARGRPHGESAVPPDGPAV